VVESALSEAGKTFADIDAVAVTKEPGLIGALLTGISAARGYAFALDRPIIYVNHIFGHMCANFIENPNLCPPLACLVVSGGHSHIFLMKSFANYELLAKTRDDAAGEAFDKVSRLLGLGYPGGPLVEATAKSGNPEAVHFPRVKFPDSLDFSFSGLKTAVINYIQNEKSRGNTINVPDVCASFEAAATEILAENLIKAAKRENVKTVALAGGVASNFRLRNLIKTMCAKNNLNFSCPRPILCTDNAAMIGCAAFFQARENIGVERI
jgi:N6-L-threonylcarbamoyladenine synthase